MHMYFQGLIQITTANYVLCTSFFLKTTPVEQKIDQINHRLSDSLCTVYKSISFLLIFSIKKVLKC